MMRKIFYTLLTGLIILYACDPSKEPDRPFKNSLGIKLADSLIISNQKVIEIVKDYIVQDSVNTIPRVYKLLIEERDFNLFLTINAISNYNGLMDNFFPVGYFIVNDNVVMVNCRLENVFGPNAKLINELTKVIEQKVDKSFFDSTTFVYDPPIWQIRISHDSTIIDKHARSPDVPVREAIKFLPPKIKE